jgi:hypothetical protein
MEKDFEDQEKGFRQEFFSAIKARILDEARTRDDHSEALKNWRSWGSWFSWGSPVGLGIALMSVGVFLVLLHVATIIK